MHQPATLLSTFPCFSPVPSAQNLYSIANTRPGVKNGYYDYRLAVSNDHILTGYNNYALGYTPARAKQVSVERAKQASNVAQSAYKDSQQLSFADGDGVPCVPMALKHYAVAEPLLRASGDTAGANHCLHRAEVCASQ